MMARWSWGLVSLMLGCGPTTVSAPSPAPVAAERSSLDELAAAHPDAHWHYEVTMASDGDLRVEALIRGASEARLHVDSPAGRFVRALEERKQGNWRPLSSFDVTSCIETCRIRYRFGLADAADDIGDTEVADRHHDTILSPPTAWLLRPPNEDVSLVFRVRTSADFVTGLWPVEGAPETYAGDSNVFWRAPYSAFGVFDQVPRDIDGARVEVAIEKNGGANRQWVMTWLDNAIRAVTTYFGRFPVPRAAVIVLPTEGDRVHGKELGGGGASVLLWVGKDATPARLARDWVGVHEMVHLAVPMMPYRFGWLAEGLATYVEPLARAQAGMLSEADVWRDMVRGMPNGQPERGDRGLDRTRTWGRLYWGGAMFALVADVGILRATNGQKGLQDALRATLAQGGHNGESWSIDRFMRACDEATGTDVMTKLYKKWSTTPVEVDLDGLWRDLGVRIVRRGSSATVQFDDEAPLSSLRKRMTAAH